MKTKLKIIAGISIPLTIFGIFVLLIANNVSQMLSNSGRWIMIGHYAKIHAFEI